MLACLLVFAPALAWAVESVVVVGTGACDDPALVDQVRTVREALARRLGQSVRSEEQTLAPLGGLPRGSLAGAKRLVDEAETDIVSDVPLSRNEYVQRDQRARERLRNALEILSSIPPSSERSQILLRLRTLELQLYSGTGGRAELAQALEAILRVLPNFAFDPNTYSPQQLSDYEEIRKKLRAKSQSTLKVTTHPAGMVVYVDGLAVGPAPVTLPLPAGTYRVEVASGAHRGIAHEVALKEWAEVDIAEDLERSIVLDGGPCVEGDTFSDRAAKLGRFAALLGVEAAVGVRIEKTPGQASYIVAEAVEAAAGPKRNGAAIKLVDGKPAAGALDQLWDVLTGSQKTLLDLSLSPSQSSLMAAVPAPPPPPLAWMRPGMFAAGGLTLGLAGVSIYEGLSLTSSNKKANSLVLSGGTVAPGDRVAYDKAVRDANSDRQAMLISAGAAIVFAGATGVLWYLSREPEPPVIHF